jgi:hypothetical protein
MTKYIKDKNGKFQGSIGDGKTKAPRFAHYQPDYSKIEEQKFESTWEPMCPPQYQEKVAELNAGLEENHTNFYGSNKNHAAAVADARSRKEIAASGDKAQESKMWDSLADMLETSKEGNWKPETTYLAVHWMQLLTVNIAHQDSKKDSNNP